MPAVYIQHYAEMEKIRELAADEIEAVAAGINCNQTCGTTHVILKEDGTSESTSTSGDCDGVG